MSLAAKEEATENLNLLPLIAVLIWFLPLGGPATEMHPEMCYLDLP